MSDNRHSCLSIVYPAPLAEIPESSSEYGSGSGSGSDPFPNPYDVPDDGTTAVHQEQTAYPYVYMRPAGSVPYRDSVIEKIEDSELPPFEDTWEWYKMRIMLWLVFILNLPWVSPRIVRDYVKEEAGRDYHGGRKNMKPAVKESWYRPRNPPQDTETLNISAPVVLLPPSAPQSNAYLSSAYTVPTLPPIVPSQTAYSDAATAIRPARTPMSVTSAAQTFPSPGASSHGAGQQAMSFSWYSSSPQQYPWQPSQVYMPQISSPMTNGGSEYFRHR